MMIFKKIEETLNKFIEALTSEEIRKLIARGGYIGLTRGTDIKNFDEKDFQMVSSPRDRSNESLFAWDYFFYEEALQEFDEGDLNPPAGEGEEDEDGYLDIYPSRITDAAVSRTRQAFLDGAGGWADALESRLNSNH